MSNERIDRVEERLAWLERHVVEQDKAMLELARRLDRAEAELLRLRDKTEAAAESPTSSHDERPPHY